jgi:molybdate transport system substrate-binding protein
MRLQPFKRLGGIMTYRFVLFVGLFVWVSIASQAVIAAEVKVLSANVFTGVLDNVFTDFERSSGHKVLFEYVTAGKVRDRLQAGEYGDVAIATRTILDDLEKNGKIARGTTENLARSAVALVVRKGSAKPDVSSIDAFQRSLLAMGSISYPDPTRGGATGILFTAIADRLGIAGEIKAKTKFPPPGHFAVELVANGEAEAAIAQPMEALLQPGVEIAGLLPTALQSPNNFTFAVGVMMTTKEPDAARSLVKYLIGPSVQSVLKSKGMEPGQGD